MLDPEVMYHQPFQQHHNSFISEFSHSEPVYCHAISDFKIFTLLILDTHE